MIREMLAQFPYLDLVVAGQLIFFGVFVAALAWIFRPGSRGFYDHLSRLPLEKGADDERR